jgi:hypothetical protein
MILLCFSYVCEKSYTFGPRGEELLSGSPYTLLDNSPPSNFLSAVTGKARDARDGEDRQIDGMRKGRMARHVCRVPISSRVFV